MCCGGGNYQSRFIQRGPLSRLVVIENVALVTLRVTDRNQSRSAGCFDFIIVFFFPSNADESRERDTFKSRLKYQCRNSSSDKNRIYARLAAILCIIYIRNVQSFRRVVLPVEVRFSSTLTIRLFIGNFRLA